MAEGLDIRYQHTVEGIDWGEGGATVHCSGGKTFACDAVICTVSLGILKVRAKRPSPWHMPCRQGNWPSGCAHLVILEQKWLIWCILMAQEGHQRIFHPPLPVQKQEAIAKLAMGVVDKLFIRFHSAKQPPADGSGALESAAGSSVLSHQLLWKVCSTVGNAGFNPTTQPATDSADPAASAAGRSVLSHQLLWKVCMSRGAYPYQAEDPQPSIMSCWLENTRPSCLCFQKPQALLARTQSVFVMQMAMQALELM